MPARPHQLNRSADVVVIGGGVIGTAVAYFLARAGVDVALIERHDVGAGTTSAAAAAALLQTKTSADKLAVASRGLDLLDELHDELGGAFEYQHTGSLLAATNRMELELVQHMVATLQSLRLHVELIDGEDARRAMPVLGPRVIGASYSPRDAQINPLELVVAYAEAARKHGAVIQTFTDVVGIESDGSRICAVNTSQGRIATETVINAAGVWAADVARMVGLDVPITPLKGELLVTEPMPPMMRGTLIAARYLASKARAEEGEQSGPASRRSVGVTLVQVRHGNFIVGSTREQAGHDRRSTQAGMSELSRQLLALAPRLADVHLLRSYAGLRPLTSDGKPIIGPMPALPGFVMAAGYGGDGLVMSALSGQLIADMLTGTPDVDLAATFSYERFGLRQDP